MKQSRAETPSRREKREIVFLRAPAPLREPSFSETHRSTGVMMLTLACPKGTNENSPAFQRRVSNAEMPPVPKGRLKLRTPIDSAMQNPQSSLRDYCLA